MDNVIKNISILRQAGFFSDYKDLSDKEVYNYLHQLRIKEYSETFGKHYDPGMNLGALELSILDKTKVIYLDLEADVCADNKVYTDVIKMYDKVGMSDFNPENIIEKWDSETGPIEISFHENGKLIKFSPEYQDDWIHESVFRICEEIIRGKGNLRLMICLGEDGDGFGQDIAIMRLNNEEQKILENDLNWKFSNNF